jgi:hypothetical protein
VHNHAIKKPATAAAIARPEARYADQSLDSSLLHRGEEDFGRVREKPRRLEDDFGSARYTERLGDDIDAGQGTFTVAIWSASPAIFSSLG